MEESDREVSTTFHLLELWANRVDFMDNVLHSMDAMPWGSFGGLPLTLWTVIIFSDMRLAQALRDDVIGRQRDALLADL